MILENLNLLRREAQLLQLPSVKYGGGENMINMEQIPSIDKWEKHCQQTEEISRRVPHVGEFLNLFIRKYQTFPAGPHLALERLMRELLAGIVYCLPQVIE